MAQPKSQWEAVSPRLRRLGLQSWLLLGIFAFIAAIAAMLNAISGLVIPFVIAMVLAMLFHPVVDKLHHWRIPRVLGSLVVLVLLIAVLVAAVWIMTEGILTQYDTMGQQVKKGLRAVAELVERFNLSGDMVKDLSDRVLSEVPKIASGAANFFKSGLSGGITFLIGSFAAILLLFYLLHDWHGIIKWLGGNMGLPNELGSTLLADTTGAVREYFIALTLSSIVVSVTIGSTLAILGIPLALTVGLVTMVTSYVPYIGAIFAGAFAFLVALGSGDINKALIVLAVVLVVQNVVQTVIQNQLASDRLKLHPIVTFSSVIGGGIVFGVLGATLANPVAAMIGTFHKRILAYEKEIEEKEGQGI